MVEVINYTLIVGMKNKHTCPEKVKSIDTVVNKLSSLRRSLNLSKNFMREMDQKLLNLQKELNLER